ncbi:DUF3560 domain-containing protein [Streptomyces fuscichromogenes]|uniref:DUF3560 domain-containing protein n=1 Tax=Streptomyces fuscichromogenes TaxID=1324013 RepID=A0A918CXQ9_9ACTN|nr:DUF3560 domain-containing protein [Streptomyces fuscichromogenes]GGN44714.1 hypothetical protein GCM10011578_095980 [Streptomyces fuscichromogenes]
MTATTRRASCTSAPAQAPAPAEVPAPTAPPAEQPHAVDARGVALPRNLARLTAQAEEAGWTAAVQTQPGYCALLLTARQEAGETVLRCVWRLTARGHRWDGATLTRYGQAAAQDIAWRTVANLVTAEAPTAPTQAATADAPVPVPAEGAAETPAPRKRARRTPSVADVERARRAAEEWPEAMHARSLGDRYEGEFRRSDLLSELSVCGERFPFRFHFKSGGGHTVTLPTGDVRGTWGEVTGAAIAYVIAKRPAAVLRATTETARVYGIHAERAAEKAEENAQTAVLVGMARAALDTVRAFAQRIDWDGLTDEQYDSARGAVREAEECAEGAESAYGLGDVDTARWETRDSLAVVRSFGLDVPSAQECAERAPEPRAVAGRVRPQASAFLLRITRPGWEGPTETAAVPAGDAPAGSGVTPAVATSADSTPREAAAEAGPAEGAPVGVKPPAVLPDVVSDPGGVDGWETDGGAVEVLPVICHGNGGGVFPVAFRGPYEGTVRVSRAWLTERARRALTVARQRLTAAEEHAETCAAWRRDAYDLHQEVRRSAGVLGPDVWVAEETAGAWSARAREVSWAQDKRRQGARDAVRWRERELSALESEAREAGERAAAGRNFLARAAAGDVPAGRGAWASADGGAAAMFELPACAEVSPDMEHAPGMAERRAFVDLLADAVSARDEERPLIGRDLPSKKTHGRTSGIEKGQASASVKALVQPWKAPKIPAEGKAPTAAQLEDWQDGYAGAPVVAETEAAPGVWLPMAAVAFAETATANGWTVAMQRQGATVTVRAGGRATGKVPGEVRAVWSASLYDVTASGAWVDGVRLDTVATLHAVNATVAQQCKAPGALAEDARPDAHADAVDLDGWEGEGGALARDGGELPPPATRAEVSAPPADVVSDPSGVGVWEAEGGAVPGVDTPAPVAAAVAVMPTAWAKPAGRGDCAAANTCGGFGVLLWDVPGCAPRCAECAARVMGHSPAALRALTLPGDVAEAEEGAEAADIVIRHTHEDGTTVEGSTKGDGVWEALRPLGWTYRRTPGIFIRGSRYKGADRWKINRAADAVRALGLSCAVVIDEDMSFAEREAARVDAAEERTERYADRAGRAAASSQSARDASDQIGERFWMGQPILVGHNSEERARRDQERMHNAMRKSIAEDKRAGYWASRAAAAEAYERYRKNPGRTLRRIEKLEAERRGVLRERDGVDDKGRTADVWRRGPSESRREELTRLLAEYDEELTYWAETIKEAERRGFKVWGKADFVRGDFARWRGSWYEVTRVNAKTVTVPHIHAAFDGGAVGAVGGCRVVTRAATAETRHKGSTYTLPYNEVSGRMSAEQMRAALAGEAIPADPRDVTPEPTPEEAEAERADDARAPAEHQDQTAPAPLEEAPPCD